MFLNAHDADPIAVLPGQFKRETGESRIGSETIFAEPGLDEADWAQSTYRRLVLASSGPVFVGAAEAMSLRCEVAKWPSIAKGLDRESIVRASASFWPAKERLRELDMGIGSPAPLLVILADKRPDRSYPLAGRHGVTVLKALRLLGWDELGLYLASVPATGDAVSRAKAVADLVDAFRPYEPRYMTLGALSSTLLQTTGVPFVRAKFPQVGEVERVEEYRDLLVRLGVQTGPWADDRRSTTGGPPVYRVETLPHASHPFDLPKIGMDGVSGRDTIGRERVERSTSKGMTKAYQAYVTGQVPTLEAAADLAAEPPAVVRETAAREGWLEEREKGARETREKIRESAVETDAQNATQARDLAGKITVRGLTGLLSRIEDGSWTPTTADMERVGKLWLALAERGDSKTDPELAKLQQLSPTELIERLKKQTESQWGPIGDRP